MVAPAERTPEQAVGGDPDASHGGEATAKILQQDPTMSLVEITCECGRKMVLQCVHAVGAGQDVALAPAEQPS